jgi:NADH:ubiquinone oxidoreductase subunit K
MQSIISSYNYWIYILLMMIGLYAMLAKNNLVKKVIGMSIFQTAIIVFYVSTGAKEHATIPIIVWYLSVLLAWHWQSAWESTADITVLKKTRYRSSCNEFCETGPGSSRHNSFIKCLTG